MLYFYVTYVKLLAEKKLNDDKSEHDQNVLYIFIKLSKNRFFY